MLLKLLRYLAGDNPQEMLKETSPGDPDEHVNMIKLHGDLLDLHVEFQRVLTN